MVGHLLRDGMARGQLGALGVGHLLRDGMARGQFGALGVEALGWRKGLGNLHFRRRWPSEGVRASVRDCPLPCSPLLRKSPWLTVILH